MKKIPLVASFLICGSLFLQAQEQSQTTPKGKAIVQAFGNFYAGFGEQSGTRGFALDRAYIGYQYDLGNCLSVKGVMDMGAQTDGYDRVAYIKNAQVSWRRGNWMLNGGLISTTQFNMVEKHWGYRYIYKSFQDEYKFGSSADLGVSAAYTPTSWLALDAIITNGEGYKKVQVQNGLQYGLGATFSFLKGLQLRAYASINEQPDAENVVNYATFVGYKHNRFSFGAEYNYMQNYKGIANHNKGGFSLYGTVKTGNWSELYVRYDDLASNESWAVDDESVLLVGAQFKMGKYVKLAPNFRIAMPKEGDKNGYAAFISCYFGL